MCFSLNIVDQRIHISSNKWVVSVEHLIKQAPWTPNVTLWTVLFFLKELWGGINWSAFDGHSSLLIHVAFNETSKTKITKLYLAFPKNNFTLFIIAMNGWTDGKIIICFSKNKKWSLILIELRSLLCFSLKIIGKNKKSILILC